MNKACFNKCLPLLKNIFKTPEWFQKGFSKQQCLLTLLKKWKNVVEKGKAFYTLLTSVTKELDCLNHELFIAKLKRYSFTLPAL